jgi:hypothetical protein
MTRLLAVPKPPSSFGPARNRSLMLASTTASRISFATTSYGNGALSAASSQTVRMKPLSVTATTAPARRMNCLQDEHSCSVTFFRTGLVPGGNDAR